MSTTTMTTLWPRPLRVIGGTGEYESGKSMFGITIAPGPDTLVFDQELSTEPYQPDFGFKIVRILEEAAKQHPEGDPKPIDVYLLFLEYIKRIERNKYKVIIIDPASEIEDGLADWVRQNPAYFSHTPQQYIKMQGVFWGDVKARWKAVLNLIATKCETFYFTVHTGNVWKGGEPTTQKKSKGKSTLMEMASLFLWFERRVDAQGFKPEKPAARVVKSRLSWVENKAGVLIPHPILPPRIPVATPDSIRHFMLHPYDAENKAADYAAPETSLSDDDRLEIQLALQTATERAEAAKLERIQAENAREKHRSPLAAQVAAVTGADKPVQSPTEPTRAVPSRNPIQPPAKRPAPVQAPPAVEPLAPSLSPSASDALAPVSRDQLQRLSALKTERAIKQDYWLLMLLKRYNVDTAKDLMYGQAQTLIEELEQTTKQLDQLERDIENPDQLEKDLQDPSKLAPIQEPPFTPGEFLEGQEPKPEMAPSTEVEKGELTPKNGSSKRTRRPAKAK